MNFETELKKWSARGLITPAQATAILDHEKHNAKTGWKGGVTMAGIFAILLGIALVIASNWQAIPATLKIISHFGINAVLAGLVWHWKDNEARKTHLQIAASMLFGLTLTFIALIGQVYHAQGTVEGALKLWFVITAPLVVLFVTNRYTVWAWALLVYAIMAFLHVDLLAILDESHRYQASQLVMVLLAMAFIVQEKTGFIRTYMPVHGTALADLTKLGLLLTASLATHSLYISTYALNWYNLQTWLFTLLACLPLLGVIWFFARRWLASNNEETIWIDIAGLSLGLCLVSTVPLQLSATATDWVSAGLFILYWLVLGAAWQAQGMGRGVSLAIWVVSIRLFVMFLQLFGSQLMTGFGLIITGVLLLGLVRLARMADRALKKRIAA